LEACRGDKLHRLKQSATLSAHRKLFKEKEKEVSFRGAVIGVSRWLTYHQVKVPAVHHPPSPPLS